MHKTLSSGSLQHSAAEWLWSTQLAGLPPILCGEAKSRSMPRQPHIWYEIPEISRDDTLLFQHWLCTTGSKQELFSLVMLTRASGWQMDVYLSIHVGNSWVLTSNRQIFFLPIKLGISKYPKFGFQMTRFLWLQAMLPVLEKSTPLLSWPGCTWAEIFHVFFFLFSRRNMGTSWTKHGKTVGINGANLLLRSSMLQSSHQPVAQ